MQMGRTKTSCYSRNISLTKFYREGENAAKKIYILAFLLVKWNEQMIITRTFLGFFFEFFFIFVF